MNRSRGPMTADRLRRSIESNRILIERTARRNAEYERLLDTRALVKGIEVGAALIERKKAENNKLEAELASILAAAAE
jgi:hypothetical protein